MGQGRPAAIVGTRSGRCSRCQTSTAAPLSCTRTRRQPGLSRTHALPVEEKFRTHTCQAPDDEKRIVPLQRKGSLGARIIETAGFARSAKSRRRAREALGRERRRSSATHERPEGAELHGCDVPHARLVGPTEWETYPEIENGNQQASDPFRCVHRSRRLSVASPMVARAAGSGRRRWILALHGAVFGDGHSARGRRAAGSFRSDLRRRARRIRVVRRRSDVDRTML